MTAPTLDKLRLKTLRLDQVDAAPYNPRVTLLPGDREYVQIEASLDEFGMVEPLVVNEVNNRLVGGHQRLRILKAKGYEQAQFSVVTISDEAREKALNVALNRSGRWDLEQLGRLLPDLGDYQTVVGFTDEDLERMRVSAERDETLDALRALGQAPRADAHDRPTRDGTTGLLLSLSLSPEQHETVLQALAWARDNEGALTQQMALATICQHYLDQATA